MKIARDFSLRPQIEQTWIYEDTWCDSCGQADLGMVEPEEFEEAGEIFVQGKCAVCRSLIRTVLHERKVS